MQVAVASHTDCQQGFQCLPIARVHVSKVACNGAGVASLAEPQALEGRGDLVEEEGHDLGQEGVLVGVVVVEGRARHHRGGADIGDAHVRVGLCLARLDEAGADRPTRLPDAQIQVLLGLAPVLIRTPQEHVSPIIYPLSMGLSYA